MAFALETRLVRTAGLMSTPVDTELVVLNLATNNYIALDEIGRRIWELLESPWCVGDLCRQLSREFEATPEQIAGDVLPFLEELAGEDMVRVAV